MNVPRASLLPGRSAAPPVGSEPLQRPLTGADLSAATAWCGDTCTEQSRRCWNDGRPLLGTANVADGPRKTRKSSDAIHAHNRDDRFDRNARLSCSNASEALIRTPLKELLADLDRTASGRCIAVQSSTSTRCPAYCARTRKKQFVRSRGPASVADLPPVFPSLQADVANPSRKRCPKQRRVSKFWVGLMSCSRWLSSASPPPKAPVISRSGSMRAACRGS